MVNITYGQRSKARKEIPPPADTVLTLSEVVVRAPLITGKLQTTPGSLSVLTKPDMQLSDGTNLATIINTMPGVIMQSGTNLTNRIVIRGMGSRTPYNSNRIRAYLNEIPMTSSDGISTPEEIEFTSLGRIEVTKGPSSVIYGSGLGGALNLYTPEPARSEIGATAQYGSYNTTRGSLSGTYKGEKADIAVTLNRLKSDGYRENNSFKRASLLSEAELRQKGWSLNILLLLIGVDGGIPSSLSQTMFDNEPQSAAPGWKAVEGFEKYKKGVTGITLTGYLSDNITNKLTLFTRWNDSYEKRPFNNLDDNSLGTGFRNILSIKSEKTETILGAEWHTEKYEWSLLLNDSLINMNRENRTGVNVFGIFSYKPVSKLNITIAGALNHVNYHLTDLYSSDGDQTGTHIFPLIFSPRIGLNYAPADFLSVYASAGHGFSLPSPEETLLPDGNINPDIEPEQGLQYEVGTRINSPTSRIELDAAFYHIDLNNLLVTKRISEDIFTGINAGKTSHTGIELLLRNRILEKKRFPGRISSVLSYTWSVNKFIDFTDDGEIYDGNNLPGIPDHSLQLQMLWAPFVFQMIDIHLQYSGKQFMDDGNSMEYQGHFLVNLKLRSDIATQKSGTFSIYGGVNNLTNSHYASMILVNAIAPSAAEPRYYYPGMPVNFYAGLQYRF